jgi:hypothetical protein
VRSASTCDTGAGFTVVVDDVDPDLEDPVPSYESLVECASGELGEVVDVASERGSTVAGELLGACLCLGDDGEVWELEW